MHIIYIYIYMHSISYESYIHNILYAYSSTTLEYELVIFWKNIILCSCMHITSIMHTTTLVLLLLLVVLLLLQYYYYSSSTRVGVQLVRSLFYWLVPHGARQLQFTLLVSFMPPSPFVSS